MNLLLNPRDVLDACVAAGVNGGRPPGPPSEPAATAPAPDEPAREQPPSSWGLIALDVSHAANGVISTFAHLPEEDLLNAVHAVELMLSGHRQIMQHRQIGRLVATGRASKGVA